MSKWVTAVGVVGIGLVLGALGTAFIPERHLQSLLNTAATVADHGQTLLKHAFVQHSFGEPCAAVALKLTGPWAPPEPARYVPNYENELDRQGGHYGEADTAWEQAGEHQSSAVLEHETQFETWCFVKRGNTCLTAITGNIGFTPSVITLREDLRRNRCARKFALRHEMAHAEVT